MNAFIYIVTVVFALSLPVMYIIRKKIANDKRLRIIHGALFALGILATAAVCVIFKLKVSSAAEGIRGWAEDFFFSCFVPALIFTVIVTGLLCGAAAVRHNMRRTRMIIAALLPTVGIVMIFFWASLAEGGYFAVDLYIRAAAPGIALLPHAVPLCERKALNEP